MPFYFTSTPLYLLGLFLCNSVSPTPVFSPTISYLIQHTWLHTPSLNLMMIYLFLGVIFQVLFFFLNLTSSITLPENVQNKNNNNQFVINVWSLQPGDFIYKL